MLRPPRSKGRFKGTLDGTSLSNPYAEADGRRLRRRYAIYAAVCLVLISGLIALFMTSSGDEEEIAPQAPKGSFIMETQAVIPEVKSRVKIFRHSKSGMPVLTMVPEDTSQDGVFGINFRTPSEDDTGAAHIVQQAIQSGSKNFPIKDPFNQLDRGSLKTYMNTWTDKDRSTYVYASRNKVDFRNGVKVYLDGVFNPNMMDNDHNWIFRQEAWRLYTEDPNQTLRLGGNTINDAKSAQMNPETAHDDYVYKKIFDGHPYNFLEKGDWRQTVTLTRSKMKDFYTKYYHPSNGQAFCFGPQDFVDECLNLMEPYLSEYNRDDKKLQASDVGWLDLSLIKSIKQSVPYPSYQDTNDFRLAVSYVLNDQPIDDRTKMAWFLLEELLVGNNAAIIPRLIVDLDLGDDCIGYLQSHLRQWILTLGVSGAPSEAKVEEAGIEIERKVVQIAADGFDDDAVKAALNKLEMKFREQSSDGEPRGVQLFKTVLSSWSYGGDPRLPLVYSTAFAALKKEIEDTGQEFILGVMTKHLVDNNHRLVTELYPSTNLATLYAQQEQEWLDNTDSWLSKEQGIKLLQEAAQLKETQQTADPQIELDKISSLNIKDLRTKNFEVPVTVHDDLFDSGVTMLEHELSHTNGVAYIDFSVDISNMDFDDVVLLPLFCKLLVEAGSSLKDGIQFQREVDTHSGGITIEQIVEEIVSSGSDGGYLVPNGQHMTTKIVIRTSCLAETGCLPMFTLIKQILFDSDVQKQAKAIEILKKMIDDMEDDIQVNAHEYTTRRIESQYGLPGFIREQWRGMTQLLNLRRALVQAQDDWSTLSMRLVLMADNMRRGNRNGMVLSLVRDKASIKAISSGIEVFLVDTLPAANQVARFPDFGVEMHPWYTKGMKRMTDEINAEGENEAFIVPSRVNAVAKGGILFDIGEPVRGYDVVVLQFIGGYFLYDELRFGQGASEAWAVVDIDTGSVVYQSAQDPNIMETLEIYDQGASWVSRQLSGNSALPVEAEGAVIGAIGAIDGTAMQPSLVGYTSLVQYLKQDSNTSRQRFRDEILNSKVSDFMAMVDRLGSWGKPSIAVVTNQVQYDKAIANGLTLSKCDYTGLTC